MMVPLYLVSIQSAVGLPDDGPIKSGKHFVDQLNSNCLELCKTGFLIVGSLPRYHVGDQLNISCISPNSVPAAKLKWFINGEYADSGKL